MVLKPAATTTATTRESKILVSQGDQDSGSMCCDVVIGVNTIINYVRVRIVVRNTIVPFQS